MAIHYWDGSTDTDWATAANWTAALPVADGEVIFDNRQVTKPTTGMSDGGSASDSGHANACTFDLLHFKKGYTGGIGTAALPLVCAPDKIIIDGTGTYHICCGGTDQSTDKTVPLTIINNSDAIVYLYSNCNDGANLCEFTDVYVTGGKVYIAFYSADTDDQGCYVKNLYLVPRNNSSGDVTVTMEKDAYDVKNTVATNVYMQNGTLLSDSMIATFNMYDGTVYYGSEPSTGTAVTEADMDIATLRQMGGTFYWEPDDTGTPTITTAHLLGGTFDASGTTSNDIAKTITTAYLYKGATMDINDQRGNITLTNLYRFGGTLTMDEWAKIAITYDQA
jgi:hypothetical protein